MVKNRTLCSFATQRNSLIATINRKAANLKITATNEKFNSKHRDYKVNATVLTTILSSIEAKMHKCEMLFFTYFEDVNHEVLSGNGGTHAIRRECTFQDGTALFKEFFECDDKVFYRNLIDTNFQTFILMMASIYENLVHVIELISKKIIVHGKNKAPVSVPFHDFIECFDLLVDMGYRKTNELDNCIATFKTYFQTYLTTINQLRNSFIHGYSRNLASDGVDYKIVKSFDQKSFSLGAPALNIDIFTQNILTNTKNFILSLYPALEQSIRHHTRTIPVG